MKIPASDLALRFLAGKEGQVEIAAALKRAESGDVETAIRSMFVSRFQEGVMHMQELEILKLKTEIDLKALPEKRP